MSDTETFRRETRAWLETHCPAEMRATVTSEEDICWGGRRFKFQSAAQQLWLNRMVEKGWTVPSWPRAYGGAGLNRQEAAVLLQEMRALGCRPPLESFGIWMLGPALLHYGSEPQKLEHLPPIARGEIRWCQGYSEPNAGSDLASLATRGVLEADHFVVNGQKIWTSYADQADWIFCLVRTDAEHKHAGISFLLFDMLTPGVSTRPIQLISGQSPFCETFFDDVRVPRRNLVGQLNGGWAIAKFLLAHEREMIGGTASTADTAVLGEFAAHTVGRDATGQLSDRDLRSRIAAFAIDEAAFTAWLETGTAHPAALKFCGAELNQRRWDLKMSAGGSDALEWEGARSAQGALARTWLRTKGNSIEGGTSEVMLNVIAKQVLGLPGK